MTDEVKTAIIDQAVEQRRVRDTLILQKVNRAHREAFKQRFPGQVEHVMRLTAERLQAMLTTKPEELADPATWVSTAAEIRDMSESLYYLAQISVLHPVETNNESN